MDRNDELLLAVLNSAPVSAGIRTEELSGAAGSERARRWGGTGSPAELATLRRTRDALQAAIRGEDDGAVAQLRDVVSAAVQMPHLTPNGIAWELHAADDDRLAVEVVMAWSSINDRLPGRLRPCANDECNLFLIDRSRPGTARWCSMATCGNRMKARSHAQRSKA